MKPDRNPVAPHQIPLAPVLGLCVSERVERGMRNHPEPGRIRISNYFCLGTYRMDSHSTPTPEPVWELLRFTASRASIKAVIIEWDVQLPAFEVMQREVGRAQAILRGECDDVARHADRLGAIVH